MKILFFSDPGGSSGGPGHLGSAYFNGLLKYYPECVGGFAFTADGEEHRLYSQLLDPSYLVPVQTETLADDPGDGVSRPRPSFYRELCEVARRHGCDHIHLLWGFVHPVQLAEVPLELRLPVTMTLCDAAATDDDPDTAATYFDYPDWERYLGEVLQARVGYLTISNLTRRDALRKGVPAELVRTVHLWLQPWLRDLRTDDPGDYLFYAGGIAGYKGVTHLLDFALLYPEYRIEMCGYTYDYFPVDFGRYPSVNYRGYVPYREAMGLMAAARAVFFLSYSEGFGWPMIEAQELGAPLIVNPKNAMVRELLAPGSYVSAENVNSPTALKVAVDWAARCRDDLRTAGFANAARYQEERQVRAAFEAIAHFHRELVPG